MALLNFGQGGNNLLGGALSTAGGVLGGIGGALVPGVDLTGASEVGGAAAGSAGGQQLANWLTGTKTSTLGAGAEGALGQGTGKILGAVGGKVLGKVGEALGNKAPDAIPGAEDVAYDPRIRTALTSPGHNVGEDLNYTDTRNFMRDKGIEGTPEAWSQTAGQLTGKATSDSGPLLNKYLNQVVEGQGEVRDVEAPGSPTIMNQINSAMDLHGDSMMSGSPTAKFLASALSKANTGADEETGATTYSSSGLMNALRQVENRINTNPLTKNPAAQVNQYRMLEHEVLPDIRNLLENSVYKGGEADKAIADLKVTPEMESEIQQIKSPQMQQYARDLINNSTSVGEYRSGLAPLVNADRIAGHTLDFEQGPKPLADVAKTVEKTQAEQASAQHPLDPALQAAAKAAGGGSKLDLLAAAAGGTRNLAAGAANKGNAALTGKIAPGTTLPTVLGQIAAHGPSAAGVPLIEAPGVNPQSAAAGAARLASQNNQQPQGGQGGAGMSPLQQAFGGDEAAQRVMQTMALQTPASDAGAFSSGATGMAGAAAGLAPQLQAQQQAATILGGIPGQYAQAPTGLLGGLEGMMPGTPGYAYNQQAQAAQAAIAKLLGISPEQAAGLLPQLLTPEAAPGREQTMGGLLGNLGAGGAGAASQ